MSKNYDKITYEVWEQITIEWKVLSDNNFPLYTHSISNLEQSFWLKSNTINLNNFTDKNLIINWEISELSNKLPVLQIKNIKTPNSKMIVKDNRYFFIKMPNKKPSERKSELYTLKNQVCPKFLHVLE